MEKIPWRPDWLPTAVCFLSKACSVCGVSEQPLCCRWVGLCTSVSRCIFKDDLLSVTPDGANGFGVSSFPP